MSFVRIVACCLALVTLLAAGGLVRASEVDPAATGPFERVATEEVRLTNPETDDRLVINTFLPLRRVGRPETDGPFPVVFMHHGLQAPAAVLFDYGRHLATWGFVSIHVQRDGLQFDTAEEVKDLRYVVDFYEERNAESGHVVSGRLNMNRVGTLGYSEGGTFSVLQALDDDRIDVIVGFDPVDTDFENQSSIPLVADVTVPMLVLTTDRVFSICTLDAQNADQFWQVATGPRFLVRMLGGDHCGLVLDDTLRTICYGLCGGASPMPARRQSEISLILMTAWFQRFLKDDRRFETWAWGDELKAWDDVIFEDELGAISEPTPTPEPTPPASILVAGYLTSQVTATNGGTVEIIALTENVATAPQLEFEGTPTGITLESVTTPQSGPGTWSLSVPLAPGSLAEGRYLLSLQSNDTASNWPYLTVTP